MSYTYTHHSNPRRFAPVPLTVGLAMILMSVAAMARRFGADFSVAIASGGVLVLAGVVWAAAAIHRVRSRAAGSIGTTPG